jgi:hypothetical protein
VSSVYVDRKVIIRAGSRLKNIPLSMQLDGFSSLKTYPIIEKKAF